MILAALPNRSGMLVSGQGLVGDESLAMALLLLFVGAFAGALFGLLANNVMKFASMLTGREAFSAGLMVGVGALIGALIAAILLLVASED